MFLFIDFYCRIHYFLLSTYRKVLEKLPEADIGKVSLKDDVITVLLAFSLV